VDIEEGLVLHSSEREMGKGRVFLAAVAMAAASACGGDSTSPGGGGGGQPVASNQVSIGNDFFNAPNIVVPAGTTVTWTWNSGTEDHNVTFSDASSGDKSGVATYTRQFTTPGTFSYRCTLHAGMTGSVLVQ
jgi:plastocyanin